MVGKVGKQTGVKSSSYLTSAKEEGAKEYTIKSWKTIQRREAMDMEWETLGTPSWIREDMRGPLECACPSLSFICIPIKNSSWWLCHLCLNTTVHAHVSPCKTALKAAFNHQTVIPYVELRPAYTALAWLIDKTLSGSQSDFSTDTGASCSQASLEEPSAVVIYGIRPTVTAPHLV